MFQSVTIAGRLGKDPEMRYTAGGDAVTQFSVAVDGFKKGETEWFNVVCWNKTAEAAAQYLTKGSKVLCAGRMQTRSWEKDGQKHYRTELVAERVQFLDSRQSDDPDGLPVRDVGGDIDPDDLPF